jgi:hypothetical protein
LIKDAHYPDWPRAAQIATMASGACRALAIEAKIRLHENFTPRQADLQPMGQSPTGSQLQEKPVPPTHVELEAAAFRRLLQHLNEKRPDVQNIDLMIFAGFCRNCLADWYREAAAEHGVTLDKEAARERIYGEPFDRWKAKHQKPASAEQLAAFERSQRETH